MAQFSKAMSQGLFQKAGRTTEDFLRHRLLRCAARLGILLCALGFLLSSSAMAVLVPPSEYRTDRILIKPKARVSGAAITAFHSSRNASVRQTFKSLGGIQVLQLPAGASVS